MTALLLAIVCIIAVVVFWRIFVPLGIVAMVGFVVLFAFLYQDQQHQIAEREKNERRIAEQIEAARTKPGKTDLTWSVQKEADPASSVPVPRVATVQSNDGLCRLSVRRPLDGRDRTDLDCPLLKISAYDGVEVKFDNRRTSDRMRLKTGDAGAAVTIPEYQYRSHLPYEEFIRRLTAANGVAIKVVTTNAGTHWISFTLSGSPDAIGAVYGDTRENMNQN